jgi:hypothetical protein
VYGDFRSVKSAIASSAASNSAEDKKIFNAGSAAMTVSQVVAASSPPSSCAASWEKCSTRAGSNCVPLRFLATAIAASIPPAR